jgi:hypothetical protein
MEIAPDKWAREFCPVVVCPALMLRDALRKDAASNRVWSGGASAATPRQLCANRAKFLTRRFLTGKFLTGM